MNIIQKKDPRTIFNELTENGYFKCVGIENKQPIYETTQKGQEILIQAIALLQKRKN